MPMKIEIDMKINEHQAMRFTRVLDNHTVNDFRWPDIHDYPTESDLPRYQEQLAKCQMFAKSLSMEFAMALTTAMKSA